MKYHHVLVGLLVFAGACADQSEEQPTISFLSPSQGEVLAIGAVPVSLIVDHAALVEPPVAAWWTHALPWSEARAHSEGATEAFVRLSLDGVEVLELSTTQGSVDVPDAGDHAFDALLIRGDGTAFDTPPYASVSFTTEAR